jgi:putative Holliday junction resolvase
MKPILGIDLGSARIGLAISDELRLLAHPLQTIPASKHSVDKIVEIVRERKVAKIVVGIPRHMSGAVGKAANEAFEFATKLRALVGCGVDTWDERMTTLEANRALRDLGKKSRQSRKFIDQVAAQIMLQSYLDRERNAVLTK